MPTLLNLASVDLSKVSETDSANVSIRKNNMGRNWGWTHFEFGSIPCKSSFREQVLQGQHLQWCEGALVFS